MSRRPKPDITQEQRSAMVHEAILLMQRDGLGQRSAAERAAEPYGISYQTVTRHAVLVGTPLSQYISAAAKARSQPARDAKREYQAADLRRFQHELTQVVELATAELVERKRKGEKATALMPEALRASLLLARIAIVDERLDKRMVPRDAPDEDDDDDEAALREVENSRHGWNVMQGGKA